jgi:PIN domain nuclease of toxin-antitoxin system
LGGVRLKGKSYLFDTHALIFWYQQTDVSAEFIDFFGKQNRQGQLFISSISFWEIALLAQKGRVTISDVPAWTNELLNLSGIHLLEPSVAEMIDSTLLPPHHKDPFDRLLIAQANQRNLILVSRDKTIQKYDVPCIWM